MQDTEDITVTVVGAGDDNGPPALVIYIGADGTMYRFGAGGVLLDGSLNTCPGKFSVHVIPMALIDQSKAKPVTLRGNAAKAARIGSPSGKYWLEA